VIIGDGKLRSALEAESEVAFAVDDVVFLGTRNDREFLSALDIVALTSLNEGTPLTLIEADGKCASGNRTEVGGVVDLLGPTGSAGNAEPSYQSANADTGKKRDAEGLARGLARLIEDESLRIDLGVKGRDWSAKLCKGTLVGGHDTVVQPTHCYGPRSQRRRSRWRGTCRRRLPC